MPLSIFMSMLWIMYVQLLPTRLAPSIKRATLPFSVFFHLQSVSIIFLLIAANVNFCAKLLIYIDLTKHFTNFPHQNTIFIRAMYHKSYRRMCRNGALSGKNRNNVCKDMKKLICQLECKKQCIVKNSRFSC